MANTIPRIEELIRRHNSGDSDALEELINVAYDRLLRLIKKIKYSRPLAHKEAETGDIMSELWIRMNRALKSVELANAPHFFRLAAQHVRFALVDILRKYRTKEQNEDTRGNNPDNPMPVDPQASEPPVRWEHMMSSVDQLSDAKRDVFDLLFVMHESVEYAADTLGVSQRQVRRRYREARTELMQIMQSPFEP